METFELNQVSVRKSMKGILVDKF